MDNETYLKVTEEFTNTDSCDGLLFFDSSKYETIKQLENINYFNHDLFAAYLNNKIDNNDSICSKLSLVGIFSYSDKGLLATLEKPQDYTSKWSVIKIWIYDEITNRPQLHSKLLAKDNSFDQISISNHSILLNDGDFVYRIVLDNDYRFGKNMDIFVSLNLHEFGS
jgi:hypothetical protein